MTEHSRKDIQLAAYAIKQAEKYIEGMGVLEIIQECHDARDFVEMYDRISRKRRLSPDERGAMQFAKALCYVIESRQI